uniref:Uncharacterized protein n=1 Tax=Helianthus annuus TaxID=4232 RepID=A0A251UES3_HELAN
MVSITCAEALFNSLQSSLDNKLKEHIRLCLGDEQRKPLKQQRRGQNVLQICGNIGILPYQ